MIAGDSISYSTHSATHIWWNRYHLYAYLKAYEDSVETTDTLLTAFLADYDTGNVAKLDSLKQQVLDFMHSPFSSSGYETIRNDINGATTANDMEGTTKSYIDLLMRLSHTGNTPTQIAAYKSDIMDIARLCVFEYGPSVFEAQAYVISDSLELMAYPWQDSCIIPKAKWDMFDEDKPDKPLAGVVKPQYKLIPSLVNGKMNAYINLQSEEIGLIKLYSISGREIINQSLKEGKNTIQLANMNLDNGLYIYKVWVNGELKRTDKLVKIE